MVPFCSSADWFSFGCMLYKLLKGHSPFRQHNKNKKHSQDKNEIDKITLTQDIELPDQGFSAECRDLLEGLLKREVHERLGCRGKGFLEWEWQSKGNCLVLQCGRDQVASLLPGR